MEETEKMTALKKAYAEIILNTAKEAAARIIVSERRAQLFQRDLSATKEEALRIMLRIKQMIDLKMNEDETKSLIQRKRIDELEAQLQEAEDIVSNLRADLYEAEAALDKLSRNEQDSKSHNHPEETATNVQQNNRTSSCDGDKTDVTRSRKPGLYRNGCTERIRGCDRKLLTGRLSVSEEADYGGYRIDVTKDSHPHSRLKRKRGTRQKRNTITLSASETSHNEVSNEDRDLEGRAPAADTHDVTDNDLEVADALILITQEKSDAQVSDLSDIQSPKSRILKYTFQRKRRRESNQSLSSPQNKIHIQTT